MCVANNVHLTTIGNLAYNNSQLWLYSNHAVKSTYQRQETMTQKQERFMWMEINFALGKNGGYMLSSLGGKSISMGTQ